MSHTLLAFHGFTMNAECMRAALEPIASALAPRVDVVCLNAPHVCAPASVERLYRGSNAKRLPPPYLSWWDASDDGLSYRGWEETRDLVREALDRYAPVSILGFSQGAILAAAVAALAHARELPPIRGAVLVAGRKPRAAVLQGAFLDPIAVPSLHVWGERDSLIGPHGRELAEQFAEAEREIVTWPGGHVLPSKGPGYEAIVRFVSEHATG